MQTIEYVRALRETIASWRQAGQRIAFVPTMGNLHAGHHSLIALARQQADRVVASVFVNPTQFGPNEDFARYPRTPREDEAGLDEAGCDLLFRPSVDEMYPFGAERCVAVRVPGLTDELDGAARPGHFDGVATVVLRLFNMVQPDAAVFGLKDFQQLRVIQYLVRDLALPITIVPAPIARDADGLALSSRNRYLGDDERALAPELHHTLLAMRDAWRAGAAFADIQSDAIERLRDAGFAPDYAQIRRDSDLAPPSGAVGETLIALAAARLGTTRLIDNLAFTSSADDAAPASGA